MVPVQCHVSIQCHDIVDVLDISCRFVNTKVTERALGIELGFNEHADKL